MKRIICTSVMMLISSLFVVGQTSVSIDKVQSEIVKLRSDYEGMQTSISSMRREMVVLTTQNKHLKCKIESLNNQIGMLHDSVYLLNSQVKNEIIRANNTISANEAQLSSSIKSKSLMGIVVVVFLALVEFIVSWLLRKKVKGTYMAIEKVKDQQNQLQKVQSRLEEESIQLDNKLVDLIEKKLNNPVETATDHSLALKVADEITRMELNLSRMDSSIKGYKQITKAIERIKNNFLAKGYEFADMLGKPYNEGMRIHADFVLDENLEPGTRIITSITKPQVTFKGEMIQKAIVTVTQNI